MLNQPKIALAVLYKLHQHADQDGTAISATDVGGLFNDMVKIPSARIGFALEELENRQEVVREHDRYSEDETVWRISATGMKVIDRQLSVPRSFVARLAANTDSWLNTPEAEAAELQKSSLRLSPERAPEMRGEAPAPAAPIVVNNTFSPNNTQTTNFSGPSSLDDPSVRSAGWLGAWGTWVGVLVALVTLAWILHEAKVF